MCFTASTALYARFNPTTTLARARQACTPLRRLRAAARGAPVRPQLCSLQAPSRALILTPTVRCPPHALTLLHFYTRSLATYTFRPALAIRSRRNICGQSSRTCSAGHRFLDFHTAGSCPCRPPRLRKVARWQASVSIDERHASKRGVARRERRAHQKTRPLCTRANLPLTRARWRAYARRHGKPAPELRGSANACVLSV